MSRTWLLLSSLTLIGCVAEVDAPEGVVESEILGPTTWDASCHPQDIPDLARALYQGQVAANSQAFAECISTSLAQYNQAGDPSINIGPYRACAHDPVGTTVGTVLAVARSQNPMTLTCDYSAIGTSRGGSAGLGNISLVDSGSMETISLGSQLADPTRTAPIANTIWHEIMHQHGYDHMEYSSPTNYACGISPEPTYANSIPYIVGECMSSVLNKSKARCSQMTTACGEGLQLVESVYSDSSPCVCAPAPQHQTSVAPRITAASENGGVRYAALDNTRSLVTSSSFAVVLGLDWSSAFAGKFWSPPTVLAGVRGANTTDYIGHGTDGHYYHRNSSTGGWVQLAGMFSAAPAVVSPAANRIDVFGLGTDHRLYHQAWTGSWQPLEYVGGVFNGPPTAIANWGTIEIVGRGTDNRYYHKSFNGSAFTPPNTEVWDYLGPTQFVSEPALAAKLFRLDIFGQGADMRYYHQAGVFQPVEQLPGIYMGPPAARWQNDGTRLDVVGQGTNAWYYHLQMSSAGAWSGITGLSMAGYGGATIVGTASDTNDVLIEGWDHHGHYQRITGSTWSNVLTIPGGTFLD